MARFLRERSLVEELFVQAASAGDLRSLASLGNAEHGGSVPSPQFNVAITCYEALQFAAQNGHASIVKDLLLHLNAMQPAYAWMWWLKEEEELKALTTLMEYSSWDPYQRGRLATQLESLLRQEKGWHFNGVEMTSSPLHLAVKRGHLGVVREIIHFFLQNQALERGSDDACKAWFQGLLEWAVRWGRAPILQLLLTPPMLVDGPHSLPLHLAAHHNHLDVLKLLLQRCKAHDSPFLPHGTLSNDGLTALHLAAQSGSSSTIEILLHQTNMDVNARSHPEFFTPLHMAANSGSAEVVGFLLQGVKPDSAEGASASGIRLDLTARDCMGRTALHYAAREGHEDVVQQLLDCCGLMQGSDNLASIADYDGLLPLHMAARVGHVGCIKKLRSYAGSGMDRCKAEDCLNMKRRVEMEYMTQKSIKANLYYGEKIKFPRLKLIDTFFWKTEGFMPLHFAARYGHEEAVRELMKEGSVEMHHMDDHEGLRVHTLMDVQKKGEPAAFLMSVDDGGIVKLEASLISKSKINEEKKAMEELRCAWDKGATAPLRMHIVQWLEDEEIGSVRKYWLRWAVEMGDMDLLKRLLVVFAEFQAAAKEFDGCVLALHCEAVREALGQAIFRSDANMARELLSRPPGIERQDVLSALHQAMSKNDGDMVREILLHVPAIERKSAVGALLDAVREGCFAAAKEILLQVPEVVLVDDCVSRDVKTYLKNSDRLLRRRGHDPKQLEDFLMALVTREGLVGASTLLRWMLPWAKECKGFERLVDLILERPEPKKGLYEDRQVNLDCANAILVGAALIAGVAFQGWLQPPLGYNYGYEGVMYIDVHKPMVNLFWRFNNGAFFLAVAALIMAAKGAMPMAPDTDMVRSVEQVKRAVAVASTLMGMALVCVVVAFTAAGFAVLPLTPSEEHIMMRKSVTWGATICAVALVWFYSSVLHLLGYYVRVALLTCLARCWLFS